LKYLRVNNVCADLYIVIASQVAVYHKFIDFYNNYVKNHTNYDFRLINRGNFFTMIL